MPSKPTTLIQPLYQILVIEQLDNFSVLELRDRYLALSPLQPDRSIARRFVYRHILRLVSKKLLNKVIIEGCSKVKYKKTVLFSKASWDVIDNVGTVCRNDSDITSQNKRALPKKILQERLEQCESDFLACLREFETYQGLSSEFPHLKDSLLDVRHRTKVQSSKLVGEIRAIKMALSLS